MGHFISPSQLLVLAGWFYAVFSRAFYVPRHKTLRVFPLFPYLLCSTPLMWRGGGERIEGEERESVPCSLRLRRGWRRLLGVPFFSVHATTKEMEGKRHKERQKKRRERRVGGERTPVSTILSLLAALRWFFMCTFELKKLDASILHPPWRIPHRRWHWSLSWRLSVGVGGGP